MNKYGEQNIQKAEILPTRLVLELTEERMKIYEAAAALEGMPLRQWLMNIADVAAEQDEKTNHIKQISPPIQPIGEKYFAEVIGNIAAGALAEGDTIPYTVNTHRPLEKNEYVLRVNGKSMEPDIIDGSLVVMRKHTVPPIPKVGTIVEYYDERGVTIKKLAQRKTEDGKKQYILHSINPKYPDVEPMDGGRISAVYVRTLGE